MDLTNIKKIVSIIASAVFIAASVPFSVSAVDQQQRGCIDGYNYEMWNQDSIGKVSIEPDSASFTCSWEDVENCLFAMGRNYDNKKQNYKQILTFYRSLSFEVEYCPKGNSFIGVYGWTRNQLLEYYKKFCKQRSNVIIGPFTPYLNPYARIAVGKRLLPRLIPKRKLLGQINFIECESHRDVLLQVLHRQLDK